MSGAGAAVTCSDRLPADGEGGPGLHHVHGNGAVVVGPRAPGQFHRGVGDVSHLQALGGTGGSCGSRTDKEETRQHQHDSTQQRQTDDTKSLQVLPRLIPEQVLSESAEKATGQG